MATLILPDLGENVEEGDIVSILVKEGDVLSEGQALLEVETGKATVEVPAETGGTIQKVLVKEGDKIKPGQAILELIDGEVQAPAAPETIEVDSEPTPDSDVEASEPESAPPPETGGAAATREVEFAIPDLGDGVEQGDVINVLVKEGDILALDQSILEVETGKATVEIPTTVAGKILAVLVQEGDKVKPLQAVLRIEATQGEKTKARPTPTAEPTASREPAPEARPAHTFSPVADLPAPAPLPQRAVGVPVRAAPSVRKFAREIGLDIREVTPSTDNDRISIEDVKAFAKRRLTLLSQSGGSGGIGIPVPPMPDFSQWGPIREEGLSTIRRLTAQHMALCWSTIPHVTQNDQFDITAAEDWRKQQSRLVEKEGAKLTLTAVLIKMVAQTLKAFPSFNATMDMVGQRIIYKDYIHIGIAVDTPKGLVVPVIKDCAKKSILEISHELTGISERAREGKISPDELKGGTFTITNLGGIGGGHFTPIVNHPEVAILGVGRGQIQPVFINGSFAPRMLMPVSLSYDHRLIDGADGARFITALKRAVEYPLSLL